MRVSVFGFSEELGVYNLVIVVFVCDLVVNERMVGSFFDEFCCIENIFVFNEFSKIFVNKDVFYKLGGEIIFFVIDLLNYFLVLEILIGDN